MEDISNVSSEEELLQLRNEGKIDEAEYQDLFAAMKKNARVDAEPPAPEIDKAKQKRKLGKTAFVFMLAGIVLPMVCLCAWWVEATQTSEPYVQVKTVRRNSELAKEREAKAKQANDIEAEQRDAERKCKILMDRTRTRVGIMRGLVLLCLLFCALLEIAAFVMGVIAWPDVFGKATVVSISLILVLLVLFLG